MKTQAEVCADIARVMRKAACKTRGKGPEFRVFAGWKFGLSRGPVPLPDKQVVDSFKESLGQRIGRPDLGAASYEEIAAASEAADAGKLLDHQWIFSASLHPRGRGCSEEDWRLLGMMVAAVRAPEDSCQTPLDSTDPSAVLYWMWSEAPN